MRAVSWDQTVQSPASRGRVYDSVDQSDHGVAMGTALVYHEDMTATRLLWDE